MTRRPCGMLRKIYVSPTDADRADTPPGCGGDSSPSRAKASSAVTREAIAELEARQGERFAWVEALMEGMKAKD
jgi:hypothetical protein